MKKYQKKLCLIIVVMLFITCFPARVLAESWHYGLTKEMITDTLDQPFGIALDRSENIYIVERGTKKIKKIQSDGTILADNWGNESYKDPYDIAIDSSDNVYVLDRDGNCVKKFNSSGEFQKQWGSEGTQEGEFKSPEGIAIDTQGFVYVIDTFNYRVQVFDAEGVFQTEWGSKGIGDNQFELPRGINVTDEEGDTFVYVADTNNGCIKKFQSDGTFVLKFGEADTDWDPQDGEFDFVKGIVVYGNSVYVGDNSGRIQQFDTDGDFKRTLNTASNMMDPTTYSYMVANNTGTMYLTNATLTNYVCSIHLLPNDVTGLSVSEGDRALTVNWTDPVDSDLDHILAYVDELTGDFSGVTPQNVTKETETITISELTNGIAYKVKIVAVDDENYSSIGIVKDNDGNGYSPETVVFSDVTGVSVIRDEALIINWVDPADSNLDHILVYVDELTGDFSGVTPQNVAKGTETVTVSELTNGTAYKVKVVAVDDENHSSIGIVKDNDGNGYSPEIEQAHINDLRAIQDNSKVHLKFSAPVGATSVEVQQSIDGINFVEATLAETIDASSTEATVVGLDNNTKYYCKLVVTDGKKAGDSNVVSVIPNLLGDDWLNYIELSAGTIVYAPEIHDDDIANQNYRSTKYYATVNSSETEVTITPHFNDNITFTDMKADVHEKINKNSTTHVSTETLNIGDSISPINPNGNPKEVHITIKSGDKTRCYYIYFSTIEDINDFDIEGIEVFNPYPEYSVEMSTTPISIPFTAVGYTGDEMEIVEECVRLAGKTFTWSAERADAKTMAGIQMNSRTGVLTINNHAEEGCLKVKATCDGRTGFKYLVIRPKDKLSYVGYVLWLDINMEEHKINDVGYLKGTKLSMIKESDNTVISTAISNEDGFVYLNNLDSIDERVILKLQKNGYKELGTFDFNEFTTSKWIDPYMVVDPDYVPTDADLVEEAKDALDETDFTFADGEDKNTVKSNFTVPLAGENETNITWSVKVGSEYVDVNRTTGAITVTRPTGEDVNITLTATISKGEASDTKDLNVKILLRQQTPSSNHSSNHNNNKPSNEVAIEINGQKQGGIGQSETKFKNGEKITTVKVDEKKLEEKLKKEGQKAKVTIPVQDKKGTVVGQLNGQMVKNMEKKEAIVEIKTPKATYTLPAQQIKIDEVSKELGEKVELKDIKVEVKIGETPSNMVKVVENTAKKDTFTLVVPPVDFEVTCTYKNKKVNVNKFNSYVERTIAIPAGVDPKKITTGVIVYPDGTTCHVPTQIIKKDGKYYAKINSLTNSTYSVIWNLKAYEDVKGHWGEEICNDMGARMVVEEATEETFEPNKMVTRVSFTQTVVRALGLGEKGTKAGFNDIHKSQSYFGAVATGLEYGIINGYEDNTFRPQNNVTREEAAALVVRAMKIAGLKVDYSQEELGQELNKFVDQEKIGKWAKDYVAICAKNGLIIGNEKGEFTPKENMTKAQLAAIMKRMLEQAELI